MICNVPAAPPTVKTRGSPHSRERESVPRTRGTKGAGFGAGRSDCDWERGVRKEGIVQLSLNSSTRIIIYNGHLEIGLVLAGR